jgi:hypothetical protein
MGEIGGLRGEAAIDAAVSIRVSPRARRVGLRIDATERRVEVILPRGVAVKTGLRFSNQAGLGRRTPRSAAAAGAVRRGCPGTGAGRGPPDPP